MMDADDDKALADLDNSFDLLRRDPLSQANYELLKKNDVEWKRRDPEGYKKDMEKMCRDMCGDNWEAEYKALLREEFPDEFK
jgi:hypothetical protein